jgi:hypothetical protein
MPARYDTYQPFRQISEKFLEPLGMQRGMPGARHQNEAVPRGQTEI